MTFFGLVGLVRVFSTIANTTYCFFRQCAAFLVVTVYEKYRNTTAPLIGLLNWLHIGETNVFAL